MSDWNDLFAQLQRRYGDAPDGPRLDGAEPPALWQALAGRASVRAFRESAPSRAELRLLAALALAAPTKSDLQQRDVIIVDDPSQLAALKAIFADQAWTQGAPALVVFCANNRRQRLIHAMRRHAFVNDHLDAFFNASVDAAIVLAAFVLAAEAAGLGTCPISAIRNAPEEASKILGLPDHVFPISALAVGYAAEPPALSLRLPLAVTLHDNRYEEGDVRAAVDAYDARRAAEQPYTAQRREDELGSAELYGWSEDKTRQYNLPERVDFATFIRAKGFRLE